MDPKGDGGIKTYEVAIIADSANIPFTPFTDTNFFFAECFAANGEPIGTGSACTRAIAATDQVRLTLKVILPEGTHTLAVRVVDKGDVRGSVVDSTFTVDTTPPEPPSLVSPEDGILLRTATPLFIWETPVTGGVLDYRLQVTSGDINTGPFAINIGEIAQTLFQARPEDELPGAAYRWRVISRDNAGNTAASVTRIFGVSTVASPKLPLPPVPVQIRVGPPDSDQNHSIAGVGIEFDAEIWIVPADRAEEVEAAQVHINFDPTLLEVIRIVPNPETPLPFELLNQFDNTGGHIDYGAEIVPPGTPPKGDFLLATVEFRVKPTINLAARTDVDLALNFTEPRRTFVQRNENFIPVNVQGIAKEAVVTLSPRVFNGKIRSLGTALPPSIRHVLFLTVTFTEPATGTTTGPVVETFPGIISDRNGRFVVDLEDTRVIPDVYDVRVKGIATLSNLEEDVPIPLLVPSQPHDFRALRPGDLDLSDIVNITDFVLLTLGFGQGGEKPKDS